MVHVTAFANAFYLEAQRGPGNEDRLEFWRHGQDFDTSVKGVMELMREMFEANTVIVSRKPDGLTGILLIEPGTEPILQVRTDVTQMKVLEDDWFNRVFN